MSSRKASLDQTLRMFSSNILTIFHFFWCMLSIGCHKCIHFDRVEKCANNQAHSFRSETHSSDYLQWYQLSDKETVCPRWYSFWNFRIRPDAFPKRTYNAPLLRSSFLPQIQPQLLDSLTTLRWSCWHPKHFNNKSIGHSVGQNAPVNCSRSDVEDEFYPN